MTDSRAEAAITLFLWPQELAVQHFTKILHPHLPLSNPLYQRIRAPQNTPERHCMFAATFAPPTREPQASDIQVPEEWTLVFADRSRYDESHIWIFNPLIAAASLTPEQDDRLRAHLLPLLKFVRDTPLPDAPGWPFQPPLRIACLHERLAKHVLDFAGGEDSEAVLRATRWRVWGVNCQKLPAVQERALPEGFSFARVPEEQLDTVLSTSIIKRNPDTMLQLPNLGLLDQNGRLTAWGYIGM
jgi:hypothetical protein